MSIIIKMMKKAEARRLRKLGFTFEEVGKFLGVTKQRVQQVAGDIKIDRGEKEDIICFVCGKKKTRKRQKYIGKNQYCSKGCREIGLKKKIMKISMEGKVLEVYDSLGEAARDIGCSQSQVGRASNPKEKKYRTARGYILRRI